MENELDPILADVFRAREYARLGDYDSGLGYYAKGKVEIEGRMKSCRNRSENAVWNKFIKDIVTEESGIRRIRSTIDDICRIINVELTEKQTKHEEPEELVRPDFVTTGAPRRLPNKAIRRVNSKKRPSSPQKAKPLPVPKEPKPSPPIEKPPVSSDPLLQQIIDLGILCREPNVQWESIAGLDDVKRLLRQNLVILPMRPDIARGLLAPWRSLLFYGPPGTGKTFLAKAVATECHRTFFNITSATITSRFHGESEKLVTFLFHLAEQLSPSTIFFDEIDSLASQRGTAGENEASRRMKAELLTKMEGIESTTGNVFVMAATNFPWDLDEALLRRFQKRIYIPLPDARGREELLRLCIGNLIDETFNMKKWVAQLEGYSCADITNLGRDVAQVVFEKQMEGMDTQAWLDMSPDEALVTISNEDFERALSKRKTSVDPESIKRYEDWRAKRGAE